MVMPDLPLAPSRWRIRLRVALLLILLVTHLPFHGLWRLCGRRSPWPTRFLRLAGRASGVDTCIIGAPLRRDVLIVANHLSWLDILILAGVTGTRFVAKGEVATTPVLGFLAGLNRTIYVARAQRGEVRMQADLLRSALREGQPVTLFPEGTTGDGRILHPFRASLLSALEPPPPGILLQPVVIDYGKDMPSLVWGDTGIGAEMQRVLALPGRRTATLRFLDPIDPADHRDRKLLTKEAQRRIAKALGQV